MKIAILGSWGMNIYNHSFGGFEEFVTQLSKRLVKNNFQITIYCRKRLYTIFPKQYEGVNLIYVPSIEKKNLATLSATLIATLHAVFLKKYDILFYVNVGMGFYATFAKIFGKKVVINVDGLDWERDKWSKLGKSFFFYSARTVLKYIDVVLTDNGAMAKKYFEIFRKKINFIPYGGDSDYINFKKNNYMQKNGIKENDYYLVVSRLTPENNPEMIIRGFSNANSKKKLVIVGKPKYMDNYYNYLKSIANHNVVFLGYINDQNILNQLLKSSFVYIHGHSAGGTNPILVRAMAHQAMILYYSVPYNKEVVEDAGIHFDSEEELRARIREVERMKSFDKFKEIAKNRTNKIFNWEKTVKAYEIIFKSLI